MFCLKLVIVLSRMQIDITIPTLQVRCKEVRRIDQVAFQGMESNVPCEHNQQPSSGMCYSVEIKGRYLAPWVTSAICDAFSSNSTSFEARYTVYKTLFTWII